MKIVISLIILLSMSSFIRSYGQTYNEIVTQAYSAAYIDNDYNKAAELFDMAFALKKAKSSDLYYAAEVNLNIDSTEKFIRYLSQSVYSGYANYYFISKQTRFEKEFDDLEWAILLNRVYVNYHIFEEDYQILKDSLSIYYKTTEIIEGKIDLRIDSIPVKHQGSRNTCSVFAATALMEYVIWAEENTIIDLSESYNYWAAKTYALTNDYLSEIYSSVDGLAAYLAVEAYKYGSMDEENWKYENTNWKTNKDERCKEINGIYAMECFTGIPPENSKKLDYIAQPVYIDREDIGQYILQEKKPVVMNIFWYFDAIDEKGNFRLPNKDEIKKGGHVILLVGYDYESKSFIFQNSWGKKWGENGYGTIPEEYIINYFELAETFPYAYDASDDEKIEAIKGSMGVSATLIK